jgi:hypothetical protein
LDVFLDVRFVISEGYQRLGNHEGNVVKANIIAWMFNHNAMVKTIGRKAGVRFIAWLNDDAHQYFKKVLNGGRTPTHGHPFMLSRRQQQPRPNEGISATTLSASRI